MHAKIWRTQTFVSFVTVPGKRSVGDTARKWDPDEICKAVKMIPLFKRRTIRDLVAHAVVRYSKINAVSIKE